MNMLALLAWSCAAIAVGAVLFALSRRTSRRGAILAGVLAGVTQWLGTIVATISWPRSEAALAHGIARASLALGSLLGIIVALACVLVVRRPAPAPRWLVRTGLAVVATYVLAGTLLLAARERVVSTAVPAECRSTDALVRKSIEAADARSRAQAAGPALEAGWKDAWTAADVYGADPELSRRGAASASTILSSLEALPAHRIAARVHLAELLLALTTGNEEVSRRIEEHAARLARTDPVRRVVFDRLQTRACNFARRRLAFAIGPTGCPGVPAVTCTSAGIAAETLRRLTSISAYYSQRLWAIAAPAPIDAFTVDQCLPVRLLTDGGTAPDLEPVWAAGLRNVVVFAFATTHDAAAEAMLAQWPNRIPASALRGASLVFLFADGTSAVARAGDP